MGRRLFGFACALVLAWLCVAPDLVQAEERKAIRVGFVTLLPGPAAGPFGVPAKLAAEAIVQSLNAGKAPAPYVNKGLLDEPFEGVAPALARRLSEVIAGLKQEGLSILLTESDLSHSKAMLDTLFIIDRGEVTPAPL